MALNDDFLNMTLHWKGTTDPLFPYKTTAPAGEQLKIYASNSEDKHRYALWCGEYPILEFDDFPANWLRKEANFNKLDYYLQREVAWKEIPESRRLRGKHYFLYYASIEGKLAELTVNDFPAEPLHTLHVNGESFDIDKIPQTWKTPESEQQPKR